MSEPKDVEAQYRGFRYGLIVASVVWVVTFGVLFWLEVQR